MRQCYREYYKLVKFLKENLPFQWPVTIRRIVINEANDGDCTFVNDRFIINIEKRLPEYFAAEVLIHEIAHALSWGKDKDFHGKHWGIAYSRVYRLYLRYLMENEVTMNAKINCRTK